MRKSTQNFGVGGAYICRCCKRKTRSTDRGDNEEVRLCEECYELSGIENSFSDGDGTPAYAAEAADLLKSCIAKGGKTSKEDWSIPFPGEQGDV
jgi:hypothetical protein